jgi:hypothetical protein
MWVDAKVDRQLEMDIIDKMRGEEHSSVTGQKHTQKDERTSSKIKMLAEERRRRV